MELLLLRTYSTNGTNGEIFLNDTPVTICFTIELPWLNNKPRVSCIPEGKYGIVPRNSTKFGDHFLLKNVPERSLILIHPANDAVRELKGCIAPVTQITGDGKGSSSRLALQKLSACIMSAKNEPVYLTIKSKRL